MDFNPKPQPKGKTMKIESIDSIAALNLKPADNLDELLRKNEDEYPEFNFESRYDRESVVFDIAEFGFSWGCPLAEYLPEGHDEVDPSDKDISSAIHALTKAAADKEPAAMLIIGEWCTHRCVVANFRTSVWDIAKKFLTSAANSYKKDPLTAAYARETLARLYEDGHYYCKDNEAFAQKLRSSAASIREAWRKRKQKQTK